MCGLVVWHGACSCGSNLAGSMRFEQDDTILIEGESFTLYSVYELSLRLSRKIPAWNNQMDPATYVGNN